MKSKRRLHQTLKLAIQIWVKQSHPFKHNNVSRVKVSKETVVLRRWVYNSLRWPIYIFNLVDITTNNNVYTGMAPNTSQ